MAAPATLGSLLRHFRLRAEFSQESLAERARISIATVSALERGTRQAPYRETVLLLAQALRLSAEDRAELITTAQPSRQRLRRFISGGTMNIPESYALRGSETVVALPVMARGHNLPVELSSFVGSDKVVSEVARLVSAHRLVTLVGSGGVGKTRVALQVAEKLFATWPDGVRLVERAGFR